MSQQHTLKHLNVKIVWYEHTLHYTIYLLFHLNCYEFKHNSQTNSPTHTLPSQKMHKKWIFMHRPNYYINRGQWLPFVFGWVRKCLKYFTNSWFVTFPPFFNIKFRISAKDSSLGAAIFRWKHQINIKPEPSKSHKDGGKHKIRRFGFVILHWQLMTYAVNCTTHDQRTIRFAALEWAFRMYVCMYVVVDRAYVCICVNVLDDILVLRCFSTTAADKRVYTFRIRFAHFSALLRSAPLHSDCAVMRCVVRCVVSVAYNTEYSSTLSMFN